MQHRNGHQSTGLGTRPGAAGHAHPTPNFFLVGAAKCGTTSLASYLSQHPDIFFPRVKEPFYFVPDFGFDDFSEYLTLFRRAGSARAIGEGSTAYLFEPSAPVAIKQLCPQARIIIMLRDPVSMAHAYWRYMRSTADEDASFQDAIAPDERSKRKTQSFRDRHTSWWGNYLYLERAAYEPQVRRYLETFGREAVKVLIFERFIKEPEAACRDVFGFLGVDPHFTPDCSTAENAGGIARWQFLTAMRNCQYPLLRTILPAAVRSRARTLSRKLNTRHAPPEPIPPKARRMAETFLEPFRTSLCDLLEDPLPEWPQARSGRDK